MYKVKINNGKEHSVSFSDDKNLQGLIDGEAFELDMIKTKEGSFHVIKNNHSYTIEVIKADTREKNFTISINGNKYQLNIKDKFDELLHSLGFDNYNANKINEIKAPMPGLVLEIKVNDGDTIKKGDALIVLEAMKMENILKSPADGVIKKIHAKKGLAVEKNQVLISF